MVAIEIVTRGRRQGFTDEEPRAEQDEAHKQQDERRDDQHDHVHGERSLAENKEHAWLNR